MAKDTTKERTLEETAMVTREAFDLEQKGQEFVMLGSGLTPEEEKELDRLTKRLEMSAHNLTSATKVLARDEQFDIVDAVLITDFEDKKRGEVLEKVLFMLEYRDGEMVVMMQSAVSLRKNLAEWFGLMRRKGMRPRLTNRKLIAKQTGEIQPALIFEAQKGATIRF